MMKRVILTVSALAVVAAAGAAVVYGPPMWQGYRFMEALDAHDAQYQANGGAWPQQQDTCALCHGTNGQPGNGNYAALAGQPAAYLEAQLHAFAQGSRRSGPMEALAASLSDEQIKSLASYYARQKMAITEMVIVDRALEEKGKSLVAARGCAACHGKGLPGGQIGPRIAGQGQGYLKDQLDAFRQGRRKDPSQAMNAMAAALSDTDIAAVSHYLANLAPSVSH
ncbi:c-type cytochrome [Pseudomonas aeruginosa]